MSHLVSSSPRKLTQPHLSINNVFPPINSRPTSEDLRGISTAGATEIHATSKQHPIRRQAQTIDQHRRSPLRSNTFISPTSIRYPSAPSAAAATAVQPLSVSISPLVRSPSLVQTGSAKSELDITTPAAKNLLP